MNAPKKLNDIFVITDDGTAHEIRVVGTIANPHFFGSDVCKILDIKNPKKAFFDNVENIHKIELKTLIRETQKGLLDPYDVVTDNSTHLLGFFDLEKLSHNDGRAVVLSELGLHQLLNGTKHQKHRKSIESAVRRWIWATRYVSGAGLADLFTFVRGSKLAFDLNSEWFKDLWYPLSKSRPPHVGGPTRDANRPIIVTQNLLDWMGFQGRDLSDKQEKFSRVLKRNEIAYEEIGYTHPLVIEYPCVQVESEQLLLSNNQEKKKWICLGVRDFKKAVMRLQTENGDLVRDYYLNLEEAMVSYGEYTARFMIEKAEFERRLKDEELSGAMSMLAIKDKEIESEKEAREVAERDAREHRAYALVLKEIAINDQKRPINEIIYISTSKAYAAQNRFKVGGVESMDKLKGRFSGYNGRSCQGDEWYYSDIFRVANFRHCEKRIEEVIGRFREKKNKEMYVLHYINLRNHVEWICEHYEDESNKFNEDLDAMISNLNRYNLRAVVPTPYEGTSATITRIINGVPTNTVIESGIERQFKKKVMEYLDTLESGEINALPIKRQDLFEKIDFSFNKIDAWRWLKEIVPDNYPNIKLKYK